MKIKTNIDFSWNHGAQKKILNNGNLITYAVARQTLDKAFPFIPLKTDTMRKTSINAGVRGSNGDYYIGSYTSYAKYVWVMGDNTNWSTAGTNGEWYARVWRKQGKMIIQNAIERNKLK